jgi:hypothetical protein
MILDFRFWIDSIHKRGRVLGILDLSSLLEAELEPKNNPKSKIQNPKSKIQNPKSKIQNPKSKIGSVFVLHQFRGI